MHYKKMHCGKGRQGLIFCRSAYSGFSTHACTKYGVYPCRALEPTPADSAFHFPAVFLSRGHSRYLEGERIGESVRPLLVGRCQVSYTCDGDTPCFEAKNRVKVLKDGEYEPPKRTYQKKRPASSKTSPIVPRKMPCFMPRTQLEMPEEVRLTLLLSSLLQLMLIFFSCEFTPTCVDRMDKGPVIVESCQTKTCLFLGWEANFNGK